ncbi:MAG TPA: glycosyltransferase [Streptosporangiales bacterium]
MSRYLFTTWYGAGNQVPAIGLAQELAARGHEVRFAGYTGQRERFERAGFDFAVLAGADAAYRADEPPERVMAALVEGVWACPAHLTDLRDALAAYPCDAVVADCMMFGVLAALEDASVPVVPLVHSAPGALFPPGGPGDAMILGAVNAVRAAAGRRAVGSVWETWAPFPAICASVAELDPLAARAPASFHYVGPITERREPSGWRSPWRRDDPRPLVLASFSTGYAWDQTSRIARTLAALDDAERYRVLALTAYADPAALTCPPNAVLRREVPHDEVLPAVSATVCHAGHGTVAASLAHGVPVVALPNLGADQQALAARVAGLGAGIALDGETATSADIAAAVAAVLDEESYRTAAAHLARAIAAAPGACGAADLLEKS